MNVCSLMKFKLCRLCCVKYTTKLGRRKLSAKFLTKKKLNFIVDEFDGEMLSLNDEGFSRKIFDVLKGERVWIKWVLGSKKNKGTNNRDNNKSQHKIQVKDISIKILPIKLCEMKKHFHMNEPKIVCISCYKTALQLPRNIKNGESFPEKFPDREILTHKQEAVSFPDKFTDKETFHMTKTRKFTKKNLPMRKS